MRTPTLKSDFEAIADWVKSIGMPNKFVRNVGWITGAEIISRVGRIVAAIVLARTLDAYSFGIAALALTVFELVRLFCENGIGASVVRACEDDVDATANTAYRIMWVICGTLASIQIAIGAVAAFAFSAPTLGAMIAVLSGVYLIMPFGVVHGFILQRAERFRHLAGVTAAQTTADHMFTAVLALSGFGAWAIVLPKLLTAPIWLIGVRWGQPWKRNTAAGDIPLASITTFAFPVLGAELLTACRDQADKLIVSAFLGVEALGVYYFAFNAGLGLSSSLNRAVSSALYPHLCKAATIGESLVARFDKLLSRGGPALGSIYVLQAAAALLYVPLLFGQTWAHAAPLVAIFCLSGPARLAVDASRALLRAQGCSGREMVIALAFAAVSLSGLVIGLTGGLYQAAIGLTLSCGVGALLCLKVARSTRPSFAPFPLIQGSVQ